MEWVGVAVLIITVLQIHAAKECVRCYVWPNVPLVFYIAQLEWKGFEYSIYITYTKLVSGFSGTVLKMASNMPTLPRWH